LRVKYLKKTTNFNLKYLIKWRYNLIIYQGVLESVADFIQGRSNKSVSANHYLARSQRANYLYERFSTKENIWLVSLRFCPLKKFSWISMPVSVPHFHDVFRGRLFTDKNIFFDGPKKTRAINAKLHLFMPLF